MSRMSSPGIAPRATVNVYTGLAFISMTATLVALIYIGSIRFMDMRVFS